MTEYLATIFTKYYVDRYVVNHHYIYKGKMTAENLDDATRKLITKANSMDVFYGTYIEIQHPSTHRPIRRLVKTERVVEPWGSQWTQCVESSQVYMGMTYDPGEKNYIVRDKKLYLVMGTSMNANRVA